MVSIKDIAKECKVSVATVSKALNDQSDISAATKEKVKKAAARLGYTTNVAARALKTNKTYNIGILFADDRAGLSHEYFSIILENIQREAEKYGYDITFINRSIAGKVTTYLKHVEYRNLDGCIIISADFSDPEIIVLGGGLVSDGFLLSLAEKQLSSHTMRYVTGGVRLTRLDPRYIGVIGAASNAMIELSQTAKTQSQNIH